MFFFTPGHLKTKTVHSQPHLILNNTTDLFIEQQAENGIQLQSGRHGLSWIVMDCHGLLWTVMDYHRLSWTVMGCHGLSWTVMYVLSWTIID